MKRFTAFFLIMILVFLTGCAQCTDTDVSEKFVVIEAKESYLLVAKMGEDGKAIEGSQYTLPNYFNSSADIQSGCEITIKHNGVALETYPMQFAKIYSVSYTDKTTGKTSTVTPD